MPLSRILVTGGSGFIGSALIRRLVQDVNCEVLNVDNLTYASSMPSLAEVEDRSNYEFKKIDLRNFEKTLDVVNYFKPHYVFHLAAETHVDNSLDNPGLFIETNIVGTFNLLEACRDYKSNNSLNAEEFCFHHISTDEVFGDLGEVKDDRAPHERFTEKSIYDPSSPYSASKASSDHLVRAWGRSFNLPYKITNCSNNYGPFQNYEKFIPTIILNCLQGCYIPVYGNGNQIRDWLYVDDHVDALLAVANKGGLNNSYNIGGDSEVRNIDLVNGICESLNNIKNTNPERVVFSQTKSVKNFCDLITHVKDRAGHDVRYAIDCSKIKKELQWHPKHSVKAGMQKTVEWYLDFFEKFGFEELKR